MPRGSVCFDFRARQQLSREIGKKDGQLRARSDRLQHRTNLHREKKGLKIRPNSRSCCFALIVRSSSLPVPFMKRKNGGSQTSARGRWGRKKMQCSSSTMASDPCACTCKVRACNSPSLRSRSSFKSDLKIKVEQMAPMASQMKSRGSIWFVRLASRNRLFCTLWDSLRGIPTSKLNPSSI